MQENKFKLFRKLNSTSEIDTVDIGQLHEISKLYSFGHET